MLKHYFKTAYRNLLRRKLFSVLNIAGLSLGIALFLVLINYAKYEFSYDSFMPNADNIYRVDYYEYQHEQPILKSSKSHTGLSSIVKGLVPEVQYVAKAFFENCLIFNDRARANQRIYWADSTFISVFKLKLLQGNRATALAPPHTMIISKSQANVYFGKKDPVGQIIYLNESVPFTITGVFEDMPANTAINCNIIVSYTTLTTMLKMNPLGEFGDPWVITFLSLNPNVKNIAAVNAKLAKIATNNIPSLRTRNLTGKYELRPLRDIHFATGMTGEIEPGRSKTLLYALVSVAIFILLAAWMNYINLSLAQSFQRAEEIVIRKVYGAGMGSITNQFIVEALIIGAATSMFGFIFFRLFVYFLSSYLSDDFSLTQHGSTWFWYIIIIVGTLLSSVYPARFIAKYKPAFILKRQYNNGNNKHYLKNGLILFQLFLSILTIGCTIVAYKQIHYLSNFDLGFNTEQTISLRGPASLNGKAIKFDRYKAFRNDMLANNAFLASTATINIPGEEIRGHNESLRLVGSNNEKKQSFWTAEADEGFIPTFGLKLTAGRNIEETDRGTGCLINESALKAFGFISPDKAINADIVDRNDRKTKIVGVIKDFHQESLKKAIEPIIFTYQHPFEFGYYTFRIKTANRLGIIDKIQETWKKHYPNDPFVYHFMDDFFARQYKNDILFGKLIGIFSIMCIVIASLGLFGLASLTVVQRTKEIGIRKVVGASVWRILLLLSKDYLKLIAIAFAIAIPVFTYVIHNWLQSFSYRIELQWWMFVLPGALVLAIAWFVVSIQSLKTARANPVKSLRAE
ncbi:MAG: transporter permease [Mucilaginibacter sp.]|nr:transporter permease [Mucilaginibacter sp.]